jgi:uncharacterized protein (TIGR03083 family)
MDTWAKDDAVRQALCDYLAGLDASQWDVQSLCTEWKVRHVVAHLIRYTERTARALLTGLVKNGMDQNRFIARDSLEAGSASPESLLTQLRATIGKHRGPPMAPVSLMLVDSVCHSMDIGRPLGLNVTTPQHTLIEVADNLSNDLKRTLLLGTRLRIAGLRFVATDAAWSAGEGPAVEGPIASLILAMAGRRAGLEDLTGDGTAVLASRM